MQCLGEPISSQSCSLNPTREISGFVAWNDFSATDVNGDPITASIVTAPAHGTVTQNADGTWTYTPTGYFYGTDTFTYMVSDGVDNSNVATVTLNVAKVEIPPTLADSSMDLNELGSATLYPLASATDVNGDPLTASIITGPTNGTVIP